MKYIAKIDGNSYATDDAEFALSLMRPGRNVSIMNAKKMAALHGRLLHIGNGIYIECNEVGDTPHGKISRR